LLDRLKTEFSVHLYNDLRFSFIKEHRILKYALASSDFLINGQEVLDEPVEVPVKAFVKVLSHFNLILEHINHVLRPRLFVTNGALASELAVCMVLVVATSVLLCLDF